MKRIKKLTLKDLDILSKNQANSLYGGLDFDPSLPPIGPSKPPKPITFGPITYKQPPSFGGTIKPGQVTGTITYTF